MFPTRTARFGVALVRHGSVRLRSKDHAAETISIDGADVPVHAGLGELQPPCVCSTCRHYSRAYLHALLRDHSTEALAAQLITCHNVSYMLSLMRSMREVGPRRMYVCFSN